ncbi:enhanced serine sensitivity protein SseB C-terminal domain-containing protein [Leucothrix arctica]|uniref:Enhanced serine sensitivity protein SseB n=1 Tax=Leucothrix arctica TaxID=1481894 RepID=A0A317CDY1_9GAMM|nr:enhanced serine sensitivity protein SseB C-terminal domain-containing protein [Leucothrix arctica]PWQ94510.1 hypothetical protein DKT75_14525 [Leucothrix arctica]
MLLPANALEQALHQAAIDEEKVESFYKLMMESRVFILGTPAGDITDPEFVLTEDDELMINHWESDEDKSPVIPFFTSLQTLQKVIPEDEPYLEVPTEALFRMTLGIPMVLNPNTDFGMEFSPEDVVSLLGSDTVNNADELLDADEIDDNGIYLDSLAKQPEGLVKTLTEILKDYTEVEMAYLAVIHEPSEDPEPHLLVGILGTGDLDETIASIAERIPESENDSPFEMFDFFTINDEDPDISNFLTEQVEPFYRSEASKLH